MREFGTSFKSRVEQSRIIWLDNIKGILILAVVFGHLIGGKSSKELNIYGMLHYLIYSVHMPMFILISGYLSKKKWTWKKILRNYILPYLIFNLLWVVYSLIRRTVSVVALNVLIPTYVYWYILCLGIMRIIAFIPVFDKVFLPISVGLTIFSPFIGKNMWLVLSLGRVALLYPIFYLGRSCSNEFVGKIRVKKSTAIIMMSVCVFGELLLLKNNITDITWASHDYPITAMECLLKYVFMFFTMGIFSGLAVLVPNKRMFLTRWGRNSLLVYLIHPFVVDVLKVVLEKMNVIWNTQFCFVAVLGAVVITELLSNERLKKVYDVVMSRFYKVFNLNE
ncbi:acyltransferase family protein [Bariatricus massiliensis]|uniref:Acyltransferase family protein n=1 Tax=Bariatricus massiliensis TaxID=1745713 RepID=A0ABS8DEJ0_9FIRM|nr:acyltransferase family protein [Bariatricus massiliensis]MCB7302636.1 acyltransferase family protein [Bariatricus massiliensis]MCB7373852.1 acyltransferase family protein [Bariatricus massiliensis]MCB7386522.1 acyltransferase family protein [Bariatricus massiliensis]MCB7410684.1 acyltransferase family protein [Bariatricus massiliensis]MCQ5253478.1 acyltransferase family protein [Bariatricus massiliensis]